MAINKNGKDNKHENELNFSVGVASERATTPCRYTRNPFSFPTVFRCFFSLSLNANQMRFRCVFYSACEEPTESTIFFLLSTISIRTTLYYTYPCHTLSLTVGFDMIVPYARASTLTVFGVACILQTYIEKRAEDENGKHKKTTT